jgi:hypothetical protein
MTAQISFICARASARSRERRRRPSHCRLGFILGSALGHLLQKRNVGATSAFPLISDHIADAPTRRKSAMKRLMHRSNYLLYSIT